MTHDFSTFDKKRDAATDWLSREFATIRTGRASAALLDGIRIDSYGSQVPLAHVASVSNEDARTLRVSLWDKGQLKNAERALAEADLGVSVVADDKGLRVIFPELSSERRAQLLKLAKAKYEEARVTLRQVRDETMKHIDQREKTGEIGEDEKFRLKEDVQKRVDATNKIFDDMLAQKEVEIQK